MLGVNIGESRRFFCYLKELWLKLKDLVKLRTYRRRCRLDLSGYQRGNDGGKAAILKVRDKAVGP